MSKQQVSNDVGRSNVWTFCIYPESMPDNYIDILVDLHTPVLISPLHNLDINPDNTPKKPHYHIMLKYETLKSFNQVYKISQLLNGCPPVPVSNTKGMARYFIHYDNPEKAQYNKEDMRCLGYLEVDSFFELSFTEKNLLIKDCVDLIEEYNILEFRDFVNYIKNFKPQAFPLFQLSSFVFFINSFLKSKKFSDIKEVL